MRSPDLDAVRRLIAHMQWADEHTRDNRIQACRVFIRVLKSHLWILTLQQFCPVLE